MEISIAGNPTVDIVYTSSGVVKRYGGSILYISLALGAFGVRAKAVGVASREVLYDVARLLREAGVEPRLEEAEETTTFELDYRTKPRTVKLVKKPAKGIKRVEGDVVILTPVYDELKDVEVKAMRIVADLQGYLRARLPLPKADLVHFSYDDMQLSEKELIEFAKRWPAVVYTLGEDGAYVVHHGKIYRINSARIAAEDATGSGDVFVAALVYFHLLKSYDLVSAACEASKYVAGFLARRVVSRYDFECVTRAVPA
jgi:fructose-1-phosphate kinase PfkB-like protein